MKKTHLAKRILGKHRTWLLIRKVTCSFRRFVAYQKQSICGGGAETQSMCGGVAETRAKSQNKYPNALGEISGGPKQSTNHASGRYLELQNRPKAWVRGIARGDDTWETDWGKVYKVAATMEEAKRGGKTPIKCPKGLQKEGLDGSKRVNKKKTVF